MINHPNNHIATVATEKLIYGSRLLLVPLYLGLIVALGVYSVKYAQEVWILINSIKSPEEEILLSVIGLLDIVMIANLIVMIMIGSYSTFVSELKFEHGAVKPQWLNHISSGILKAKMAASLVGVSSIHLLQAFIKIGSEQSAHFDWNPILAKVLIHFVFLIGALLLYFTSRNDLPHEPAHETKTHEEH